MLTSEQKVFVSILADYIHGIPSSIPTGIDTGVLSALSEKHGCQAMLYSQTHAEMLRAAHSSAVYNAVQQKNLFHKLYTALAAESIRFLVFKGCEAAQYHPRPELRRMGDIDILVHREDKPHAADVLESIGMTYTSESKGKKPEDHEWVYRKNGYEVELHHRLLYDDPTNAPLWIAYTDRAWEFATSEDGVFFHLEEEFHFVYILLHMLKHFLYEGVSIRPFLDLTLMIKNAVMDWEYIGSVLNELQLTPFARRCFALIEHWFGVACPLPCEGTDSAFLDWAENFIFRDAAVATNDRDAVQTNRILNIFRREKTSLPAKLVMVVHTLFPGFESLSCKYPKLDSLGLAGYPLVPLMWVHRAIGSVVRHTSVFAVKNALKPITLNREISEREDMLKKWGL